MRLLWLAAASFVILAAGGCIFAPTPAPPTPAPSPTVAAIAPVPTPSPTATPAPSLPPDGPAQATASLVLIPDRVNPGGSVAIEVSGFGARETVTVTTTMNGLKLDERAFTCDDQGSFRATNEIPAIAPPGSYLLTARGASGATATAVLTITTEPLPAPTSGPVVAAAPTATPVPEPSPAAAPSPAARAASLVLSPAVVAPGGTVSARGSGFAPYESIAIVTTSGGAVVNATSVSADGEGNYATTQPIPAIAPAGTYVITARGQTSGATASATLTITAPGGAGASGGPVVGAPASGATGPVAPPQPASGGGPLPEAPASGPPPAPSGFSGGPLPPLPTITISFGGSFQPLPLPTLAPLPTFPPLRLQGQ